MVDATQFIDEGEYPAKCARVVSLREGISRRVRAGSNVANLYYDLQDYLFAGYFNDPWEGADYIRGSAGIEDGLPSGDEYDLVNIWYNNVDSIDITVPNINTASIFDYFQQNNTTASSVFFESWFEKPGAKTYNYLIAGANEASWNESSGSGARDSYSGITKQSVDINAITESDLILGVHRTGGSIRIIQNGSLLTSRTMGVASGSFDWGLYFDNNFIINFEDDWTKTVDLSLYISDGTAGGFGVEVIEPVSFDAEDVKIFYVASNAVGSSFYIDATLVAYAEDMIQDRWRNYTRSAERTE